MPSPPPDPSAVGTEAYSGRAPVYETTRRQRVAILSWTDTLGPHQVTIDGPTTVGKAEGKVYLADPSVSRVHLELDPRDDGLHIRDLGSKNGTYSGAMRVHHIVAGQDLRLTLGRVELLVRQPVETVEAPLWPTARLGGMVGRSEVMRGLFEQITRLAPGRETVMLRGETGTGKERVAEAIHEHSTRRGRPFVVVDCSALSSQLLESELFGHARGAFTGAHQAHEGVFEAASGGTVFLDEIAELPLGMQPKLLRVLEAGTIRRVGETAYRPVDVRVICASHRDLRELVNLRAFREDLYFRLAVIPVRLPPLRERLEDIPLLVGHFLAQQGNHSASVPAHVLEMLLARPWNGNVRELRNIVTRAIVLGWDEALAEEDASESLPPSAPPRAALGSGATPSATPADAGSIVRGPFREERRVWDERFEREYTTWLMAKHRGNIMTAAVHAGIDHSYLRKILDRVAL